MASPLYYLPGRKTATPEILAAAGLGYLLDGPGGLSAAEVPSQGPDGGSGCMFALPAPGSAETPSVAGLAAAAKFQPLPQSPNPEPRTPNPAVWFGWDPAAPPGPADLARRELIDGHLVELADGRQWLVPVARVLGGGTALPRRLAWDGARWACGEVLPRYAELYGAAGRFWDALTAEAAEAGPGAVTLEDECQAAVQALACNYRLGPGEISLLGLLDQRAELRAVKALVDWPALEELKKKQAAADASLKPGGPA